MTLCLWGPLLCYCHNINMGAVWMLYAAFDQKDMVEIIFFSLTERSKERSFQDLEYLYIQFIWLKLKIYY